MQISLIVPTRNRDRSLVRTMQSVVQTVSGHTDVEVLVVDNGSTDHTADCVREIAERHPRMFLRYFHDAMPGLLNRSSSWCQGSARGNSGLFGMTMYC